jgi:hypothetical protein
MAGPPIPFPDPRLRSTKDKVRLRHWNGSVLIRRTKAMEGSFSAELANTFHLAYPRTLLIGSTEAPPSAVFHYRMTKKWWLTEDETVAQQELIGWICRGSEKIGAIHLIEWHPVPGIGNEDFYFQLDTHTQSAEALAGALAAVWDIEELSEAGPILEFHRLWMHPEHAKGSLWRDVMQQLIRRRYAGKFSVLIQHAFPIEYEGEEEAATLGNPPFRRRFRAMQRLYTRTMGVAPFPGSGADEGWMWRALRSGVPVPRDY